MISQIVDSASDTRFNAAHWLLHSHSSTNLCISAFGSVFYLKEQRWFKDFLMTVIADAL